VQKITNIGSGTEENPADIFFRDKVLMALHFNQTWHMTGNKYMKLVSWCFTTFSAQIGYIMSKK